MNLCLAEYRWAYWEVGVRVRASVHICNPSLCLLTKPGGSSALTATSTPKPQIFVSNTFLYKKRSQGSLRKESDLWSWQEVSKKIPGHLTMSETEGACLCEEVAWLVAGVSRSELQPTRRLETAIYLLTVLQARKLRLRCLESRASSETYGVGSYAISSYFGVFFRQHLALCGTSLWRGNQSAVCLCHHHPLLVVCVTS